MAKKKSSRGFFWGMVIYAVIFLILTGVGLKFFWDFIEAYEESRPQNTANAYLQKLTVEKMCDAAEPWFSGLDQRIQSKEERIGYIRNSLTGDMNYAKKAGECTQTRQVYVLRCGKQVIGQMTMDAVQTDTYGFFRWEVTEEHYDFSYLEGEPVRVTVPETYTVSLNGQVLDESYITEAGIHYPLLEEFYDQYELPTLVTYEADHFLGTLSPEILDSTGKSVSMGENTDMDFC